MAFPWTRALGLAAAPALALALLLGSAAALAAAPTSSDPVHDWQRVAVRDAQIVRPTSGAAALDFTVTRRDGAGALTLGYATSDGTAVAGTDYVAAAGSVTFAAGETSATIPVTVLANAGGGDDRTFTLTLGGTHTGDAADVERGHATGTIANAVVTNRIDGDEACDGGLYGIVIIDGQRAVRCLGVGASYVTFRDVSLTVDPLAATATFLLERETTGSHAWLSYATVDGTARAGVDYTATSGTIKLGSTRQRAYVTVPVNPSALAAGDRSFSLRIANHAGKTPNAPNDPALVATIRHATPLPNTIARVGRTIEGAAAADATARRWERCDTARTCTTIAAANGATGATYEPTAADVGMHLRVRATVPGSGGSGPILLATPPSSPVRAAAAAPALSGGPADGSETTATSAAFTLSGKEHDAAYECSLDSAAFASCGADATVTLDRLAPGRHSLSVRQRTVDALASPATTRTWTVRSAEPSPRNDSPPSREPPHSSEPPSADPPRSPVTGRRQQNRDVRNVVAGRTNVVLRCAAPCSLRAPLTISARAARRLGLRTTAIGTASGSATDPGLVRLRVRIDAAPKRALLRIGRPVTIVARVGTTPNVVVRFRLLPRATERIARR